MKLGVLISRRGSNLRAIHEAIERGELPASIELVVCNRSDAPGLVWAREARLRTSVLTRDDLPDRARRQEAMRVVLEAAEVGLVVLDGFDEALDERFVQAFAGRIINVRSSLLPAFEDAPDAVRAAYEHGVKVSGCTVHFVADQAGGGPIILQRPLEVREVDTPETLAERILAEQQIAYPEAIRLVATGRLRIDGRRVRVL